jgi:two-component system response regulator CpxR
MAVVSIFNGIFCKENHLLMELAQKTGFTHFKDADIIAEASRMSGIEEPRIKKAFSARVSVFNRFTHEKERSIAYLKLALANILVKDNLIIDGFTTHLIPKEVTHILRVCIIADMKFRLSVAKKENHLNEAEAVKLILKKDEQNALWVNKLHKIHDPWNTSLYDIIAPSNIMSEKEILDLIIKHLDKDVLKISKRSRKAVEDFKLSSEIEVVLSKQGHNVLVKSENGNVTLTINNHVLLLSRLEEELKDIAKSIKGTKNVETTVGPDFYKADIYRKQNFEMPTKILLVDDEREFVQTLSERLLIRDMGSAVAYDGESALELIKEDEPEVMILDLRMPGIDGIEVLKRVKKTNPAIEVIILSGHGSEADRESCMKIGAFAYLQKPVDIDELSETIKKANTRIRLKQEDKADKS